jgi:hypothetical protein
MAKDDDLVKAIATLTNEVQAIRLLLSKQQQPEWITPREFAQIENVTRTQIYAWIEDGELGRNPLKEGIHYRRIRSTKSDRSRLQIHRHKFLSTIYRT